MLLVHEDRMRELIAFHKSKDATCLMTDAPNIVDEIQLEELSLAIKLAKIEEESK